MDLQGLFDKMEAAGIGRPKDKKALGRYAPWLPIYTAVLCGNIEEAAGNIPYIASQMGINLARNETQIEAMKKPSVEKREERFSIWDIPGY